MTDPAGPERPSSSRPAARGLDDPGFSYEVRREDEAVVVLLRGELDLATAPELQRELLGLLDHPCASLTLDLGELTFLDSSGLGALYRVRQAADAGSVALRLEAVPAHVMRVLDVTAMAGLFDLDPRAEPGRSGFG
jgi:anti-sigma B factor antagonist